MADSIVRLRLDSKEYDANVKMARQGLLNLEETCKKTGSSFEKADKEQVAYVQSLGKMETSSKSLRGKIGELSSAYVDLASQYRRLTDAEKNSPYGRALSQSLDELRQRTMAAREELRSINSEIGDVSSGGNPFEGMTSGIMGFAGQLGLAIGAADLLASSIKYNIETAKGFEQSLSQLKSLTGVTSEELKGYADDAIRLGGSSTQTASQVVDAFTLIGSQKPDLLASREALVAVTEAAITLAEAATIEVPEAAAALTGALNQFGLAGSESSRVINALAAGSQKGAGDINYLNAAISKCGTAAAASGVSFEQAVGAIEVLAERIPDASTAGTNLRNILLTLATQANNDFNPKIVGLQQALENLGEAEMSDAEFTKLFGKENYNAAMILRDSADKVKTMTENVTGSNTATEQAKINTDNLAGSMAALSSKWEEFNLKLNSTNGFLRKAVDFATDLITRLERLMGMNPDEAGQVKEIVDVARNTYKASLDNVYNKEDLTPNQKITMAKQSADQVTRMAWQNVQAKQRSGEYSMDEANYAYEIVRKAGKQIYAEIEAEFSGKKVEVPIEVTTKLNANASIDDLNKKVAELRQQFNAATDDASRKSIQNEINTYEKRITSMQNIATTTKSTIAQKVEIPVAGSIDEQTKKLSDLQKQFNAAPDLETRITIQENIDEVKAKIKEMQDEVKAANGTLEAEVNATVTKTTKKTDNSPVFNAEAQTLGEIQENIRYYQEQLNNAT